MRAAVLGMALVLAAQGVPGGGQRTYGPGVLATAGCPAGPVPITGESVASSSDFVELRRTPCNGGCPAYTVRVAGDGSVSWVGEKNVVRVGPASGTVDSTGARAIMQNFADRGFWGLCARYGRGTGGAAYVTTLSIGGQTKSVADSGDAAPAWLRALDFDLDGLADTHRWRHGEATAETFGDDRAVVDTVWPKKGVTRLMRVAARGRTGELREMLADTSLNLDETDSSGWTATMYAAQAGSVEAVTMLIADRANVLRRSNAGETAIHAAVSAAIGPAAKVWALVAAGVNINGADHRGVTPLMLAAQRPEVPGLVKAMMDMAADPTKRDVDGRTAMDYLQTRVGAPGYAETKALLTSSTIKKEAP